MIFLIKADTTHKIMLNMWPVDDTASGWAGTFNYPGTPLKSQYDNISFTRGADCIMGESSPPPPPPDTDTMLISNISMGLSNRDTKATAQVTVVNEDGNPVANATVNGEWSGLVNKGDGSKVTDNDGITPLFYSRRSSQPGVFTFCVTSITKEGYTYTPTSNTETCDSVSK